MKTKTILIVDDMGLRFGLFQEFFEPYFKLEWASTFDDAVLKLASLNDYSLIFLDCDLDDPAGNGVDLVRRFQKKLDRRMTIIHSQNIAGGAEMASLLPMALHIPFDMLIPYLVRIVKDVRLFDQILKGG